MTPLVGRNSAVEYRGQSFHVQTEDSGAARPHVITHLFADGGRIIASAKESYEQHLGVPRLAELVRGLIRKQHETMIAALHAGRLDHLLPSELASASDVGIQPSPSATSTSLTSPPSQTSRATRRPPQMPIALSSPSLDEIIIEDVLRTLDDQ